MKPFSRFGIANVEQFFILTNYFSIFYT